MNVKLSTPLLHTKDSRVASKAFAANEISTSWYQVYSKAKLPAIHLHISLGPHLTDSAELAFAKAVAEHLSSKCGRAVEVAELEGQVLFLWSEDGPDGRALGEYLVAQSRPLQGLLLQSRTLEGKPEPLARAELVPFVGKWFEIAAGR